MSVDTITRINAYFKANVADTYPVFTIYKNVNEDLPEPASGPFVNLWVEPSLDTLLTDGGNYQEDGLIIAQVYIEQGQSTLELHSIIDAIKVAFRQLQLKPTGGEEGTIAIEDIEPSNSGTVPRERANKGRGSNRPWRKWDVFLTYSKYECN
jgi:hypothetical protein